MAYIVGTTSVSIYSKPVYYMLNEYFCQYSSNLDYYMINYSKKWYVLFGIGT